MIGRNDICWCGSGKKWKKCHYPEDNAKKHDLQKHDLQNNNQPVPAVTHSLAKIYAKRYGILLKTEEQIAGIRAACQLASEILDATCKMAKAGVTTLELNDYAHALHLKAGALPAPLHYGQPPFPKSICTSLNEVICHGIPDTVPLCDGDIVNIDVTALLNGYYGDCSRMVLIGNVSEERRHVCDVSYECLMQAIAVLGPAVPISKIGEAIHSYAEKQHCSVVSQFVGHGVGVGFHEEPQIPHYRNTIQTLLAPGMTFTIEPMINIGVKDAVIDRYNHWTARTKDGKPSAQWEHTILITETGYELLTTWQR